ncbi:MAG: hypothetical protein DRH44_06030 [Candidatus Coatesbacteria bacterium]|nr:MAG: hypothetical protein DRH44_06030 [Candidatus Coatesbacteria bacterium]
MKQLYKDTFKTIILLTIFGIAMGYLESAVVIYLRKIYYPDGFSFPLVVIPPDMLTFEVLREVATIFMLISISIIAGKNFNQRLAYFLYNFAVWDIFYYVWLKATIGWPPSPLTWDILFLIPTNWIGPVLAPIICSFTMIALSIIILIFEVRKCPIRIGAIQWALLLSGAIVIFITFIKDFARIIIKGGYITQFTSLMRDSGFKNIVENYIPAHFNWWLFSIGEATILTAIVIIYIKGRKNK